MLINSFATWIFYYKNEFTLKNKKENQIFKDLSYYQKEFSIWLERHAEGNLYQLNFSLLGTISNVPRCQGST